MRLSGGCAFIGAAVSSGFRVLVPVACCAHCAGVGRLRSQLSKSGPSRTGRTGENLPAGLLVMLPFRRPEAGQRRGDRAGNQKVGRSFRHAPGMRPAAGRQIRRAWHTRFRQVGASLMELPQRAAVNRLDSRGSALPAGFVLTRRRTEVSSVRLDCPPGCLDTRTFCRVHAATAGRGLRIDVYRVVTARH